MEIAEPFFREEWSRSNMHCEAPGLIGAGTGLGLLPGFRGFKGALGYTIKNPSTENFDLNPQIG
jgi:hypothetical protein